MIREFKKGLSHEDFFMGQPLYCGFFPIGRGERRPRKKKRAAAPPMWYNGVMSTKGESL